MLGKTYDSQVCSIARALEVIGERWSLLIIRDALFAGVTRFSDFQHNLGIATNILTTRLDGFVATGIMERRHGAASGDQFDYALTAKGLDLAATLIALNEWGDRWAAPGEPPILYRHRACGSAVTQQIICSSCGGLDPGEVQVQLGPGMPPEYAANRRPRKGA